MAITNEDIVALASAFHDASMVKKSTAAEMAEFFLYPELRIVVLHGGNLTPELARAQGIVYWQGRHVEPADGAPAQMLRRRGLGGRAGAVGRAEVRHLRQFLSPFPAGRGAD